MRLIHLKSTGSTNREAKLLADKADFGPLWVLADEQLDGRGRRGRDWVSPPGNLYISHLFPTQKHPEELGQYSFVAALAVFDCLVAIYPDGEFGIKWPNDILLSGKKVSGLLLETGKSQKQQYVILGIGVNLISHPKDTAYPASSLVVHCGDMPAIEDIVRLLADKFNYWNDRYIELGFSYIREAWMSRAQNIPGPVKVRLPAEEFEGEALGLDQNGALQVRQASGSIRNVHAGDVFY
ncbi:MAG: biotin--[acetyl-CoA-carboxylase] ligase [Hellea sp.]|nr:biotin--[acetyl-CoA-carboxylase] ligase [Hellea sp.]